MTMSHVITGRVKGRMDGGGGAAVKVASWICHSNSIWRSVAGRAAAAVQQFKSISTHFDFEISHFNLIFKGQDWKCKTTVEHSQVKRSACVRLLCAACFQPRKWPGCQSTEGHKDATHTCWCQSERWWNGADKKQLCCGSARIKDE